MRLPGRIAAENIPLAVREGNAVFRLAGTHANEPLEGAGFAITNADTPKQAAKRSLLMGNLLFLKLTRLVRSWAL